MPTFAVQLLVVCEVPNAYVPCNQQRSGVACGPRAVPALPSLKSFGIPKKSFVDMVLQEDHPWFVPRTSTAHKHTRHESRYDHLLCTLKGKKHACHHAQCCTLCTAIRTSLACGTRPSPQTSAVNVHLGYPTENNDYHGSDCRSYFTLELTALPATGARRWSDQLWRRKVGSCRGTWEPKLGENVS